MECRFALSDGIRKAPVSECGCDRKCGTAAQRFHLQNEENNGYPLNLPKAIGSRQLPERFFFEVEPAADSPSWRRIGARTVDSAA